MESNSHRNKKDARTIGAVARKPRDGLLQMVMKGLDEFYLSKDEPVKSCLFALRDIILKYNKDITEAWKYRMPFFCYKGKMFCYLWTDKKKGIPYIGIVDGKHITHSRLRQEKRSRMKIMFVDPAKDLPVKTIYEILGMAEVHRKRGSSLVDGGR